MLSFPKDYFQTEKREDFVVDTTMKTVWAAELEVLARIDRVCQKYNLTWFADWGTLLGAVRHQGFIPWDDDIDISLMRSDYEKLMEVLPEELPKGYRVCNSMYAEEQEQFWGCVMNSDSISIEEERLREYHGCPFIVGIDIFPIDAIPRDKKNADLELNIFNLVWTTVRLLKKEEKTEEDENDIQSAITYIEDMFQMKFRKDRTMVGQLCELANQVCIDFNRHAGDRLVHYKMYLDNKNNMLKKEWFDEVLYMPFENIQLPIPKGYDEILRVYYGDYRERVKASAAHDYPFYNKQLNQLREKVKLMEQNCN